MLVPFLKIRSHGGVVNQESVEASIVHKLDDMQNRSLRLFEEALSIETQDAVEAGSVGFMARALVQATIPHRDPGSELPVWGRYNGNLSLLIQPGYIMTERGAENIGYPFGNIPRLVLAWLATEATRTRDRQLVLGESLTGFMDQIGMVTVTGGKHGSITRLREQMRRLFSATVSITYDNTASGEFSRAGFPIAENVTLWWDPVNAKQAGLWQSTVTIGESFFDEIIRHPVPVDLRILKALKQSPLALDCYCWLTYRIACLQRPTVIPWEALQLQFGGDYKRQRAFKENFLKALKQVTMFYEARVVVDKSGIRLAPGKPSVPRLAAQAKDRA